MDVDASQQARPPSLPTEIIHRIIQLALPRVSLTTFRERYDILLGFMLVDKRWMALARRELLRHVGMGSEDAMDKLFRVTTRDDESASLISSLHCLPKAWDWKSGSSTYIAFESILELVQACNRLLKLQIIPEGTGPSELDLGRLSTAATHLEELVIDFPSFCSSPSSPSFISTNLVSLTLAYFEEPAELVAVLSTSKLPNLKFLVLILIWPAHEILLTDLTKALLPYGSQLDTFGYLTQRLDGESSRTLPREGWIALTSLKHLPVDLDADLASISHLGSSLTTLRFHPPFASDVSCEAFRSIHTVLSNNPMCCEALRSLSIPSAPLSEGSKWDDEEASAARDSVLRLCAQRGIGVEESRRYALEDPEDHREAALEFW